MDLPPPVTDKAYAKLLKTIPEASSAEATENISRAAAKVKDIALEKNP